MEQNLKASRLTFVAAPADTPVTSAAAPAGKNSFDPRRRLLSLPSRVIDLTSILLPIGVFTASIILLWGHGMNWLQLTIVFAMYLLTGFGITVGFHRYFTHRAFETSQFMRYTLAILGTLCVQGPLLWWVAVHRMHHHHSDQPGDPHSPHTHDAGLLQSIKGAVHAHVGWIFKTDHPTLAGYVPDLLKDRLLTWISDSYPMWVAISMLIPAALAGLVTQTWMGALLGLVWGGILRVCMVHHITWSVNSICHIWGSQPFNSHDQSRNNWIVGLAALGEGWHNNHHAFPTSARHGLWWWQPDASYEIIRAMEYAGLVWKVRTPDENAVARKLAENREIALEPVVGNSL